MTSVHFQVWDALVYESHDMWLKMSFWPTAPREQLKLSGVLGMVCTRSGRETPGGFLGISIVWCECMGSWGPGGTGWANDSRHHTLSLQSPDWSLQKCPELRSNSGVRVKGTWNWWKKPELHLTEINFLPIGRRWGSKKEIKFRR